MYKLSNANSFLKGFVNESIVRLLSVVMPYDIRLDILYLNHVICRNLHVAIALVFSVYQISKAKHLMFDPFS